MSSGTQSYSINLEQLLNPISEERPTGALLRYEGTYDRIREARREDDADLSQGIYKADLKRADWETDESLCIEALATRSKDLQIAAWLLEAWLHLYGFAGVREGLRLLIELCERYWEGLYPEMEDENPENRISPFIWINEKLPLSLKRIPITWPQSNDLAAYSFAEWESACHLENLSKRKPDVAGNTELSGKVTAASFNSSVTLTPGHFYLSLYEDLNGATEACLSLEKLLDEKCGKDSPSLHQFRETLNNVQRLVVEILNVRQENAYLPQDFHPAEYTAESTEEDAELWTSCPIRSRAEAYWRLQEAADYLLKTEPHSPTPYLVKRAVEWGSMSLHDVFQQIIHSEGELQEINRLLRLSNKEAEK